MPGKRRDSVRIPVPLDVLHRVGGKRRSGELNGADLDVFQARLATRQEGVVGRRQLLALGLTSREIDRRLERERLIRVVLVTVRIAQLLTRAAAA